MEIPNIKITLRTVYNLFKSQDLHADGGFTDWLQEQIQHKEMNYNFFDFKDTYDLQPVLASIGINPDHLETHEKGYTYKYFKYNPKVLIKEAGK